MILVAGGTGFVGSAVARELLRRGHRLAVMSRDRVKVMSLFGADVEARPADVRDATALDEVMAGVETVVGAVQFPTSPIEVRRRGWTFAEVDVQGTRNLLAAAKSAGVRRFVYVSGAGAAEDADKHWFRAKWDAETAVRESGLEWVIVRPTWVYGPRDNSLNRLLAFGRFLPFIPLFGDGRQAMQPVFIDDVARVLADCVEKPETTGRLFELGGPEVMSMNQVLRAALAAQGRRRLILHAPLPLGKLLGHVASLLPVPPLTADAIDFIAQPAVADHTLLEEVLNPELTPLREGLATYLQRER